MQIAENTVASFHYVLKTPEGEVLESSREAEPMAYLHGTGGIIPGLEEEMSGKSTGDRFEATIPPEKAYGEHDPARVQQVPLAAFQGVDKVEPGMVFRASTDGGDIPVVIRAVEGDTVVVDANHQMAGQTLVFDIEITDVREATPQELEHGHVHAGGADH
ncbi:FKBP-type peptidyl-prolyl cis-trans isomerase [Abyssibacter profundi]|uniref:Peptidyl-prolyl cis-trans isomerase n=1 Tax=Abyssibacter profundi TaxID=2182787 RepID=A0A383XR49_9GAMM|nr:peptidylprolyl isomerase [Abyssibacter profundi]MBV62453.1 peptidylprolyl isomerase [Nevskiales bacterium]PWN55103.1 peptidylprolyl isomerase [Abyssibacter profundi]